MSRRLLAGLLLLASLAAGGAAFDYGLEARQVAPDVYVFVGLREDFTTRNGGNIVNTGFIVGKEGIVVIDSGPSLRYGEQMRAAIAKVSSLPIALVINTHHHPDHFLGNQAYADRHIGALAATREAIAAEGQGLAENLYRMSGDWLRGTDAQTPAATLAAGPLLAGGRQLRLLALSGHTGADLAVLDEASGVLFAGDLVFHDRAPTTPHADPQHWLASLDRLQAMFAAGEWRVLVPGHGEVSRDPGPIRQTRAWLQWLLGSLHSAAQAGMEANEVLAAPIPAEFADLALAREEYRRSVGHLYPAMERQVLSGGGQ